MLQGGGMIVHETQRPFGRHVGLARRCEHASEQMLRRDLSHQDRGIVLAAVQTGLLGIGT